MRYLVATGSSLAGAHPDIGVMIGPRTWGIQPIKEGRWWAGDNDAFHNLFDPDRFEAHLARLMPYRARCLFVPAPDVRPEFNSNPSAATLGLFGIWGPAIREMGFPAAYVAQDGSERHALPDADWLFIGGSDGWRAAWAAEMTRRAHAAGMRVHVGRVNSARRLHACASFGADTCDGTYLGRRAVKGHGIQRGLDEVAEWLNTIKTGLYASAQETA